MAAGDQSGLVGCEGVGGDVIMGIVVVRLWDIYANITIQKSLSYPHALFSLMDPLTLYIQLLTAFK